MRTSSIQASSLERVSDLATQTGVVGGSKDGGNEDFSKTLMDVLKDVSSSQQEARTKQNAFMTGQPVDYHDLMISMEKASTSLQLTMAVRNKVLEAYQEIARMQV